MASLGNDLASIRKEQNLSYEDIHEATKIPRHILESIEDDSIFGDLTENPTYIRSYVRSYAKALSLPERDVIYALNKQEKNQYSGSLRKFLEEDAKSPAPEEVSEEPSPPADKGPDKPESKSPTPGPKEKEEEEKMIHDHSPEYESTGEASDKETKTTKRQSPPSPSAASAKSNVPNVRSVDWADLGRRFQPLQSTNSRVWVGLAALLVIATIGYFIFFYGSNTTDTTGNTQPSQSQESVPGKVATGDSLKLNIAPPVSSDSADTLQGTQQSEMAGGINQTSRLESLPDTLNIILYAAYGKLEPVRVFTDIMGNINPYWIEEGQAMNFPFVNEIRIRGQFSRMVLLLNGHVVPNLRENFYNPETRLLEINRSYFEGDSQWLQPAPDSLGIDAPPPSVIKERPTFN